MFVTVHEKLKMSKKEEKVVSVTGGSGFIGSWIIKLLLQRGYTVKASVQNLSDPRETIHLNSLEGAKERLQLFEADLMEEGSFDSLVNGSDCVFHTASPLIFPIVDPQLELIDPAVKGTINVLRSGLKSPSIKRIVVTSSQAAIYASAKALTSGPEVVVDETWFSDPIFCEESQAWYALSKTLAEKAAWKHAKENRIDLVTINPSYVIGPMLQPTLNFSMEMLLNLKDGNSKTIHNRTYRYCVDVRDVALAHILAFEVPSASGRYYLVGHAPHVVGLLAIIRKLYPSLPILEKCENEKFVQGHGVSNEKAKNLGIKFTPLEITLKDAIESLNKNDFLHI